MPPDEFEARMRRLECFHSLRCPDGSWVTLIKGNPKAPRRGKTRRDWASLHRTSDGLPYTSISKSPSGSELKYQSGTSNVTSLPSSITPHRQCSSHG